jgi:hypothetical protein
VHATQVRELYMQAGLAAPDAAMLALPVCRVRVEAKAAPVTFDIACAAPAEPERRFVRVSTPVPEGCRGVATRLLELRVSDSVVANASSDTVPAKADADGFDRWSWRFVVEPAVEASAADDGAPRVPIAVPVAVGVDANCAAYLDVAGGSAFLPGPPEWFVAKDRTENGAVHWVLEVTPPDGATPVVPGLPLGGLGERRFRPAAVRAAIAWGREMATTTLEAGGHRLRAVLPLAGGTAIAEMLPRFRRALETAATTLPPAPGAEAVVLTSKHLAPLGVAADGGLVVIGLPSDDAPPPDLVALAREGDAMALVDGILRALPLRRDSMEFHVLDGVARGWLDGAGATDFGGGIVVPGFAGAVALRLIADVGGDKAERRARELSVVLPFQLALMQGAVEPLADGRGDSTLLGAKSVLFADALWRHIGVEAGWKLVARLARGEGSGRAGFESLVAEVAPVPDTARALVASWLDGPRATEVVGTPSIPNLLEYVVVDGAIDILKQQLVDSAGTDGSLVLKGLGLLTGDSGGVVDPLLDAVDSAIPDDGAAGVDARILRGAVDIGRLVLGGEKGRGDAVNRLVEELGGELGLDEKRRANLRWLADEALKAVHKDLRPESDASP